MREEYLIDALADYEVESDDPNRSVANPVRRAVKKELQRTRIQLGKLYARLAAATLDSRGRRLPRVAAQKRREKFEVPHRNRTNPSPYPKTPGSIPRSSPACSFGLGPKGTNCDETIHPTQAPD